METRNASSFLYYPEDGKLKPFDEKACSAPPIHDIMKDIDRTICQENYPCVAALQSYAREHYQVGFYDQLGKGFRNSSLASDLVRFVKNLDLKKTPFLTFWAVFENSKNLSESEYEDLMWKELSYLTSHPEFESDWDPAFSAKPEDKNFCFSLAGHAFYIVGIHPQSSRISRRFPYPTLLFNAYEQFSSLMDKNIFESMVATNRKRDIQFQGNVNPMVEKYSESWEAIQFSGNNNPETWKCPFHHGLKPSL